MRIADWLENGAILQVGPSQFKLFEFGSDSPEFLCFEEFGNPLHPRPVRCVAEMTGPELGQALLVHTKRPDNWNWQNPQAESFRRVFESIQSQISSGILSKAVPCVAWRALSSDRPTSANILASLLSQTGGTTYGAWSEGQNFGMLGASPELLCEWVPGKVTTVALAGTRPRGRGQELLGDSKERAEHSAVIEGITQTFRQMQVSRIGIGPTRVVDSAELSHLKTEIWADVDPAVPGLEWVRRLHPTPALGVLPRASSLSELRYLGAERGRFGAPFVYGDSHNLQAWVAIRGIQWRGNLLDIHTGCGVVAQSKFEDEWQELWVKAQSVARSVGVELTL